MEKFQLVQAMEALGTIVFALSGAVVGSRRGMDLLGVLVLAYVTAVAGGILRDVLIGVIPPTAITGWHGLALSVAAGIVGFFWTGWLERIRAPVRLLDAAGLGIFAVTGTQTALEHGLSPPMAAVLGMMTGIGGGVMRDVLTARVPIVFRAEIYAAAALAGSGVVVIGEYGGAPEVATQIAGAALCFLLRVIAIRRGWRLPISRHSDTPAG